ncbi:MAG: anti-sigma factor [Gemmatimonadaceae bacterium]|nr:anti-sigma factor [Gemmatimonadaceae bacterium]
MEHDPNDLARAIRLDPRDAEAAAELTAALGAELPAADDQLPPFLAARVVRDGVSAVRGAAAQRPLDLSVGRPAVAARVGRTPPSALSDVFPRITSAERVTSSRAWAVGGWLVAAAAALLWVAAPRGPSRETPAPVATVSPAELRSRLLAQPNAALRLEWTATTDRTALGAGGDVVWSDPTQSGVMRIAGLAPNDRTAWQYQLWIFDRSRDERYPVDGGVFDIPTGVTEAMIPIRARVPVGEAVMFAVTVERPGGVVVSTRERVALLAQRKS